MGVPMGAVEVEEVEVEVLSEPGAGEESEVDAADAAVPGITGKAMGLIEAGGALIAWHLRLAKLSTPVVHKQACRLGDHLSVHHSTWQRLGLSEEE